MFEKFCVSINLDREIPKTIDGPSTMHCRIEMKSLAEDSSTIIDATPPNAFCESDRSSELPERPLLSDTA